MIAHNGARIWGGAERATALILRGLAERGHRVLLLCNAELVRDRAAALGVPAEIGRLGGDIAVVDALAMARRLRRERPDVLLLGTFKKLWLAGLAGRLAGVPRVIARVGLDTDTPRNLKYRFVLPRWIDAIAVNAACMRAPFLALPGWTEERIVTIHNGIALPPRRAEPGAVRAALGIPPEAPVVGTIARLARQKRLDRLLRAAALMRGDTHVVLAGDGEERGALESLTAELGLAGRVHFLGARDDIADVLAALDLFVLTSEREGMSNAMVEALAAGVPVASTAVSGANEALDALEDGRRPGVLLPDDPQGIADALAGLLADRALLRTMGQAARARAVERFSFESMISKWEALLESGAGSPSRKRSA